jgi:hypothetical protein
MTENGAFGRRFFEPASQDRAANDVAAQEFFWFFFCKKRTAFLHALVDSVCTDPRHGYIRRRSALGDPMRQYLAAFVVFASLAPFSVADGQQFIQSQEGIALQNEILQLQSQVQALQYAGAGAGAGWRAGRRRRGGLFADAGAAAAKPGAGFERQGGYAAKSGEPAA